MFYNSDFLFSEVKVLLKHGHPKKTIDEIAFPESLPDNATEHEKKPIIPRWSRDWPISEQKCFPGGNGTWENWRQNQSMIVSYLNISHL